MAFVVCLVIVLESHLIRDNDFPDSVKKGSAIVFLVLSVLYIISRVM